MSELKSNFRLLRDLVMVYPVKVKQQTESGIVYTSLDPNEPIEGIVLAVGPGVKEEGELVPVPVEYGDKIVFVKTDAREVKYEKDTFLVISASDILCKVTDES
jgi:chaperonin GroES